MATKKKLLQAAAGQAGGEALNVEDVFSTYLYEGNASTQTITNGIDLSGEGGLAWVKNRTYPYDHYLYDTERGATKYLSTNDTGAEATNSNSLTSFNSNGFTLGLEGDLNGGGHDVASWTFRKAPKFFDVVTYTGTGVAQNISHSLGSVPGMVVVKNTTTGGSNSNWTVWHNSMSDNSKFLRLNTTDAEATASNQFNGTAPTSTVFSVGTSSNTNANGDTYVAYLFAHNDGDGDFGPDGDADIIKCGSYTGNGTDGRVLDLGWEPQWFMVKSTSTTGNWRMVDTMRNLSHINTAYLRANTSDAEGVGSYNSTGLYRPVPNGLELNPGYGNVSGVDYIYIAIRRGPMAVPESATDVFDIDTHDSTEPLYDTSFPVDFGMYRRPDLTQGMYLGSRMQGAKELRPNATSKEDNNPYHLWDYQNGWGATGAGSSGSYSWMWRRAPNFFDVVAYTGNGTAGRNISHNLGVAPEMIWVKRRNSVSNWSVYHSDVGNTKYLVLNTTNAPATFNYWNNTDPTATTFGVSSSGAVNASGDTYIAYLFASVDGVSKLGTFTTTSGALDVDCGFSSGARFVLLKKTNGAEDWVLFDSERGIVSGNDPYLALNDTYAEVTSGDPIDPLSSGFTVNGSFWGSGNSYIFYAIA